MKKVYLWHKGAKMFSLLLIVGSMLFSGLYAQNMNRYITLNVKQNEDINIDLAADANNTPIKIVSGTSEYDITVNTNWIGNDTYHAADTTMIIYGNVKRLSSSFNYGNLTGLDASQNLALDYLSCNYNELTTLNVSNCSNLRELYCYDNTLTSLNLNGCTSLEYLDCETNNLTSLDVSVCPNLRFLYCYDNESMTTLNISNCSKLEELDCENNSLTSLNLNGYTSLIYLYCKNNNLTTLDVTGCTKLEYLNCSKNNLTSLNVKGYTKLYELDCYENNLTTLDVSNCTELEYLNCSKNNLTSLDLSNDTILYDLNCDSNKLTTLNISDCKYLKYLSCIGNNFNTNAYDEIMCALPYSANTKHFYPLTHDADPNISQFIITNSSNAIAKNWEILYTNDDSPVLSTTGTYTCPYNGSMSRYVKINVTKDELISIDLAGQENYTPIKIVSGDWDTTFIITTSWTDYINYLSHADTMVFYGDITKFDCMENNEKITDLDVSHNTELIKIYCNDNSLTSLDVSGCSKLEFLACHGNNFTTQGYNDIMCALTTADEAEFYPLTDNTDKNHETFIAANASIAKAKGWYVQYYDNDNDITTNGDYTCPTNMSRYVKINVTKDELISVDLAGQEDYTPIKIVSGDWDTTFIITTYWTYFIEYPAHADTMVFYGDITKFDCMENNEKITDLDVSHNTELKYISCENNSLTSLDVTGCTKLEDLYCYENNLTSLNVKGCTKLYELDCYENNLTTLDVSNCTELGYLYCENNNLTSLNVTGCTSLNEVSCYHNKFTTKGYDSLMCLLPESYYGGYFYPLYEDDSDPNYGIFMASNANNAKYKYWDVLYGNSGNYIPTTIGTYDCNGLAVSEEKETLEIVLYPNPANSVLNIKNATDNVQIFDITGRIIKNIQNNDQEILQIDVSNLAKGMYFVKVGNYTTKFVKE